ncbi:MAG: type II toxin-antitoxin system RelE/ParE family toxin [Alphaproteobacteria bacterium]|nr:type II toxin-antitoxin system RelE/ParE family toxin [Alphaproteobacteria bacterium]
MTRFKVILTEHALTDLKDIAHCITLHDGPERADHVGHQIEKAFSSPATLPHRGNHPQELLALGDRTFREVHFKPYRIVYRVLGGQVTIHIVADGRRDMRALLARRLLGA